MAYTNKGAEWERKNSIFLFLSFIPFVNSVCFFHMDGKVGNNKWKKIGWIILFINIILLISLTVCSNLRYYSLEEVPYDTRPDLEDYLGRDYYEKYKYDEYSKLPEYYEYQDAVEKWDNSDEVKRIRAKNQSFRDTIDSIGSGLQTGMLVINWVIFFYVISQRATYLKELAKSTNKEAVINRLENMNSGINNNSNIQKESIPSNVNIRNDISNDDSNTNNTQKLDVNTATEEDLSNLPGLTIVDAKRAIKYREENNGFKTVEEFYSAISAKPHIVAKLDNILVASNQNTNKESTTKSKRRIDL